MVPRKAVHRPNIQTRLHTASLEFLMFVTSLLAIKAHWCDVTEGLYKFGNTNSSQ